MKKWAFVRMSKKADTENERASFETEGEEWIIRSVHNSDEAIELAKQLQDDGVGLIEVCGAFGEDLARKMYEATDKKVPVCYVITPDDQKEQSSKFWRG